MLPPKDTGWLNGYKNKTHIYAVYKRPTSDLESQKTKRREHKHNTKENHQTTKGKTKRKRKGQRRNIK